MINPFLALTLYFLTCAGLRILRITHPKPSALYNAKVVNAVAVIEYALLALFCASYL